MEDKPGISEPQLISRREVLKALAATSGAMAAAAFLPERWTRPVLQSGVLPAHAQTSVCATLTIVDADLCNLEICPPGYRERVIFAYEPADLIPNGVSIELSCDQTPPPRIRIIYENIAPGRVAVYLDYDPAAIGDCFAESVTIRFRGGCLGIWYSRDPALNNRRGLFN